VAPPGFCNRGGSEVWVYRGSRVRSPVPVPVVLSVYQRCCLLDGLAMYLSCDTKKFHDNESTHIIHNFWTSTHRGRELPPFPPGGATESIHCIDCSHDTTNNICGWLASGQRRNYSSHLLTTHSRQTHLKVVCRPQHNVDTSKLLFIQPSTDRLGWALTAIIDGPIRHTTI